MSKQAQAQALPAEIVSVLLAMLAEMDILPKLSNLARRSIINYRMV